MSYNLLLDTSFEKNQIWKYTNCKYENGYLISNNNVFGIEQELTLPSSTKLYFRWNYKVEQGNVKDVKIGIQNGKVLNINYRIPKLNKKQSISVIDVAKDTKIKLHLTFESKDKINKVYIDSPLLVDIVAQNKSTWLKWILDKSLYFMNGYTYSNLYKSTVKFEQLSKAKVGCIAKINENISLPLENICIPGNYYLIKLDYKEANTLGRTLIKYGILKSQKCANDQQYLIFKANAKDNLSIELESDDILPYIVNLRHILMIDITKMKLRKEDIPYLPFI